MANLINLQKELRRATETQEEWGPKRARMIQSKIDYQNGLIDEIQKLSEIRRYALERKSLNWLKGKLESLERDRDNYQIARMRANASNATSQLINWK